MVTNEQILELIKSKGPSLPIQISKLVNDSLLFTSARMAELVSSKKLKVSNLKVGGSPLYYAPGQEEMLIAFENHVKGKEKEAYLLLKEQKVVLEDQLEPAIRVAMKDIKDFAYPLEVSFEDNKKIFWKWFILTKEDTESKIRIILETMNPVQPTAATQKPKPQSAVDIPKNTEENKIEKAEEPKPKEQKKVQTAHPLQEQLKLSEEKPSQEKAKKLKQVKSKTKKESKTESKDISSFFQTKKISITKEIDTKKQGDASYIVTIESSIGTLTYFCRVKDKKLINETDISSAVLQAQGEKMPLIFVTSGHLNKKAQELMSLHHGVLVEI